MTPNEELPGGLHFDGSGRDVQVGPSTGIIRYYPVSTTASAPAPARHSFWRHVLASLGGVLGGWLAVLASGYGSVQAGPYGLIVLGAAGLVAGALVAGGRLSPAMPVVAGLSALAAVVLDLLRPQAVFGLPVGGPGALLTGVFLAAAVLRWSR